MNIGQCRCIEQLGEDKNSFTELTEKILITAKRVNPEIKLSRHMIFIEKRDYTLTYSASNNV